MCDFPLFSISFLFSFSGGFTFKSFSSPYFFWCIFQVQIIAIILFILGGGFWGLDVGWRGASPVDYGSGDRGQGRVQFLTGHLGHKGAQ